MLGRHPRLSTVQDYWVPLELWHRRLVNAMLCKSNRKIDCEVLHILFPDRSPFIHRAIYDQSVLVSSKRVENVPLLWPDTWITTFFALTSLKRLDTRKMDSICLAKLGSAPRDLRSWTHFPVNSAIAGGSGPPLSQILVSSVSSIKSHPPGFTSGSVRWSTSSAPGTYSFQAKTRGQG